MTLPLVVLQGTAPGPTGWISAAVHGCDPHEAGFSSRAVSSATLGTVGDTTGQQSAPVVADTDGVVIGITLDPLVEAGDAIAHVGRQ